MDRVQTQIARLMRSILLKRPVDGKIPSAQFYGGRGKAFSFSGGMGLSWWYGRDTYDATDAVASLLIETELEFNDCDLESVNSIVMTTLQKVCFDSPFFNSDEVAFAQKATLFECRGVDVIELTQFILGEIKSNLRGIVGRRCTVYPLTRFNGPSVFLPKEGLHLIACSDEVGWKGLCDQGYVFDGWTPKSPSTATGRFGFMDQFGSGFHYILLAEEYGTQKGAKFSSSLKFRMLITVLFAYASEFSSHGYSKSMAQPFSNCIQFPHQTAPDRSITFSDCGALSPFYASDIQINDELAIKIRVWYESLNECPLNHQQRIKKAVNFFNRAMNSNDIESYINYFIALDALFGVRGSVEKSIIAGVAKLGLNAKVAEKTRWLFDLRNELVHGGSRYISEWPKYQKYIKHFGSKPLADLKDIAQKAILRAPTITPAATHVDAEPPRRDPA